MATVRDPVKPEPVAKYETLVETRLAQARGRIRALDLTAAFLGFLIATMAFGLVMVLLDRWLHLSTLVRQIAFCIYGIVALGYLGRTIAWPLMRRVNPYYAALQVEHSLPAAKNSVVNWLDLRQQTLPPAIRGAVSHRAAVDISHADMEEAISPRQVLRRGGGAVVLFVVLLGLALFGPGLGRVFQPFSSSNQTELLVVKPEGGDATVSLARNVPFQVVTQGRRPDSLRFLFRYQQTDPYEERPMEAGDTSRDWVLTIPSYEVKNGFWYKVVGGEAETAEYRIKVQATPLITGFDVTYHHRPYTHLLDDSSKDPNLVGLRGTEVQIIAHTNRRISFSDKETGLMIPDLPSLPAQPVLNDPQAMQFRLVLDKDTTYQILFTSDDRERNTPISYSIKVLPDNPPVVVLTKPEQEMISLPANGVLSLEGSAMDDLGITGFTLRMQTDPKNGLPKEPLPPKPYRPGKSFQLPDDTYPVQLDYKDFVELKNVAKGQPLKAGTVVEYWLEATDNCDYPAANVGRSRSKFLTITDPAKDQQELEKQKTQAKQDQQKHETQQDQALQKQGQENKGQGQPEDNPQPNEGVKPDQERKLQDTGNKLTQQLKKEEVAKEGKAESGQPQAQKADPNGKGQPDKNVMKEEALPMPRPDEKGDKEGQPNQPKEGQPGAENSPPDPKAAKENPDQPNARKEEPKEGQQKNAQPAAKPGPPGEKPKPGDNKQDKNGKPGPQEGAARPPQNPDDKAQDNQVKKAEKKNNLKSKEDPKGGEKEQKDPRVFNPSNVKGEDKAANKQGKKPKEGDDAGGKPQAAPEEKKDKDPAKIDKNPGIKDAKSHEAEKPGDKAPKEAADPGAAPDNPKNPMKDKDEKQQGKDKQPGKPDKANKPDGQPGDPPKPEPPKEPNGPPKNNPEKPKTEQGAKGDQANPDNKPNQKQPGQGADNKEGQAKKDIDNLAKAMKSADPKARQEAQKKLEEMRKNAPEPADRQAAAEALKKASEDKSGADPKNAQKNQEGDGKKEGNDADSGPNKADQKGQDPSKGKPGDTPKNEDHNQKEGQPGQKGKEGDGKGEAKKTTAKGEASQQPNKPGSPAGGDNLNDRWNPASKGSSAEAEEGSKANEAFQKKAGVLQLEEAKKRLQELKKKANDEFLKKANVSKEDFQEYLKQEEKRLRRMEAQLKQDDKLRDPKRGGGLLPNLKVRRVQSGETKEDNLPHANQADAPPELREANREFTQLLAKPERAKDKK